MGLGRYGWVFLHSVFLSRAGAAAKILALESQLDVCLRRREGRRVGQFSDSFRFLWVILSKFWDGTAIHLCGFGTWAAFGSGKFIVGIDSGDADFDELSEFGST